MPISCTMPVSFAFVIPGHSYAAEIDGYDRSDLVPFGGASSGSRHMIDPKTGSDVAPRWATRCPGDVSADAGLDPQDAATEDADGGTPLGLAGPAFAVSNINVILNDCSPLRQLLAPVPAAITIDLSKVRVDQQCGSEAGQVEFYEVAAQAGLAPQNASCDELVEFGGVVPGFTYEFHVDAFEFGVDAPRWGTNCSATPLAGITLPAVCDTLTTDGSLRIDFPALLAAAGHTCGPDDVTRYQAVLAGALGSTAEESCAADSSFGPLSPGVWQVIVDAFGADDQPRFTAFCEGSVAPARTTTAMCTFR
jgi:hypothetical protein